MSEQRVIPGHVGYAPDYKSTTPTSSPLNEHAIRQVEKLHLVAERAKPVLQWDREKAEAWLPGLYDALKSLES